MWGSSGRNIFNIMLKNIAISFLIINLLILNFCLGYFLHKEYLDNSEIVNPNPNALLENLDSSINSETYCDTNCRIQLESQISALETKVNQLSVQKPMLTVKPTPLAVIKSKTKSVSYLPISGSGSTTETVWTDITGTDFYLSKNDFAGLAGVYLEANIKLFNGSGTAYFRIFDVTHGITVNGSEISTSSQTSSFVTSTALSLWEGYNHYKVQVKSLNSDSAVFESGRLKIMTEN
jgi:hypothetical protein